MNSSPACDDASDIPLDPWKQGWLSVLIMGHLLAVALPPFVFATRISSGESSPAVEPLFRIVRPYVDLMFLNHGYFFFAPNPGPAHLVRYEAEFADGRETVTGVFPDRNEHRPRLLYHRHFMLAEFLNSSYAPESGPPKPTRADDESRREAREYNRALQEWERQHAMWKRSRADYEAIRESMENHLMKSLGASRVTLVRREHRLFGPPEVLQENIRVNDADTYRDLPENPSTREPLPWIPLRP